jgi:hypothetical protein
MSTSCDPSSFSFSKDKGIQPHHEMSKKNAGKKYLDGRALRARRVVQMCTIVLRDEHR